MAVATHRGAGAATAPLALRLGDPQQGDLTFLRAVQNGINIANFSLGRQDQPVSEDQPLEAISVVETDQPVPDPILVELLKNQAIKMARPVEFIG